ncbi:unnamed protein product [Brassica oleracea]
MNSKFHAFMYPRFAFGHMTPYLHLANKLAEKGNRITFLLPKKAQKLLEHLSLFPQHIVFHPLTIPHVDGLPPGAQTASDITVSLGKFLTKPWTSHVIRSKLRFSFETRPGLLPYLADQVLNMRLFTVELEVADLRLKCNEKNQDGSLKITVVSISGR